MLSVSSHSCSPKKSKNRVKLSTKSFSAEFKEIQERFDYRTALSKAVSKCQQYPYEALHKIYCEIADFCKRENRFDDARKYFEKSIEMNPDSYTAWLEYVKMEEELGHYNSCVNIITRGLNECGDSENILIKGLKLFDRIKDYKELKKLLHFIPNIGSEQCWRCIVEGSLIEAKLGNYNKTRIVFFLYYRFFHF